MAPVRVPTLEKSSHSNNLLVPLVCEEFIEISHVGFLIQPYKVLPVSKKFLHGFLLFSLHTFHGLARPPRESRNFYVKISTYTCLSNNSLISTWILTKFVSTLFLCMLYQINNFQHKSKYLNVFERYFYTAC